MVNVLKTEYWSKSDAFMLPLTGIQKTKEFDIKSYLYWDDYSIEDYKLIVKVEYGHRYEDFKQYLRDVIFSSKKSLVMQSFDYEGFTILIYDISNWYKDIEIFLTGKYSRMSEDAKSTIENYHIFYENKKPKVNISIYACLYPNIAPDPKSVLDNMTPIEYVIKHYVMVGKPDRIDLETAKAIRDCGELCSIYDKSKETLVLVSQNDSGVVVE